MLQDGISVVIPTYNRCDLINRTLESLAEQDLPKEKFEVIVVDDGSSDRTEETVDSFQSRLRIKYFFQDDLGFRVAHARNVGIRNAEFATVLFLDSGMLVERGLLSKHMRRHQTTNQLVLIGLAYGVEGLESTCHEIEYALRNDNVGIAIDMLASAEEFNDCRDKFLSSFNYSLESIPVPWILFWTCHASCSTELLRQVDGFDEYFTTWGGEDIELGIRLLSNGAKFEVIEEAKAIHLPHEKSASECKKNSDENCLYIHNKHNTADTFQLTEFYGFAHFISTAIERRNQGTVDAETVDL